MDEKIDFEDESQIGLFTGASLTDKENETERIHRTMRIDKDCLDIFNITHFHDLFITSLGLIHPYEV